MNFVKKMLIATLAASVCATGAVAADAKAKSTSTKTTTAKTTAPATNENLTDKEKAALGICNIVGEGVFHVAVMRQSDIKESEAKKHVEDASKDLVKQLGDDDITKFIRDFWQAGITEVYKQNIETTDEKKREFVQAAAAEAGYTCLGMILGDDQPTTQPAKTK